jgi:putative ABC transport system permease protein
MNRGAVGWLRVAANLAGLASLQVRRHPVRTGLTVAGAACGLFLFTLVEAMHRGLERATAAEEGDDRLVVFRAGRFCPSTSRLPERYGPVIEAIPGVAAVVPTLVLVSSCATGLDVVTFRGIGEDDLDAREAPPAALAAWRARSDAVLAGAALARRRGLRPGGAFEAAGVRSTVAGILSSEQPQHRNVAIAHLAALQGATGARGWVTQFDVRVRDPAACESVAAAIDAAFADQPEPTRTAPEKAFVAQAAGEVLGLVAFARWVGLAAAAAVLAVVANTLLIAVRSRVQEFAVLSVLGYGGGAIAVLVVCEGLILGLAGGAVGIAAAAAALHLGGFSLTSEGLSVVFALDGSLVAGSAGVALALALLASALPAWRAARRPMVASLRGG